MDAVHVLLVSLFEMWASTLGSTLDAMILTVSALERTVFKMETAISSKTLEDGKKRQVGLSFNPEWIVK